MHEMGPKIYMNIFGCQGIEWTNIQIYSDAKEFIEQLYKHIPIREKSQMQIWIICVGHFIQIFKYSWSSLWVDQGKAMCLFFFSLSFYKTASQFIH